MHLIFFNNKLPFSRLSEPATRGFPSATPPGEGPGGAAGRWVYGLSTEAGHAPHCPRHRRCRSMHLSEARSVGSTPVSPGFGSSSPQPGASPMSPPGAANTESTIPAKPLCVGFSILKSANRMRPLQGALLFSCLPYRLLIGKRNGPGQLCPEPGAEWLK